MIRQHPKLIIVAVLIVVALLTGLLKYQTSYDPVDISGLLEQVEKDLGEDQEVVILQSKNSFSFYDLLFRNNKSMDQDVYGILTFPENTKSGGNSPAIVGVAGSKGWGEHHYGYMQRYREAGIATLVLHSFKSRNVSSTVGEQTSATTAMLVHDAFKALEALSNDQRIDRENIGITGWSLGGGVALFTAWKPLKDIISPEHTFAAHLPIYPPCMVKPQNLTFTPAPIHILIGEDDNWVPADACIELVEFAKKDNLEITTYVNAHHSFDRNQELITDENAYSFTHCRLDLTDDGMAQTISLGIPLSNSILQKTVLAFCAERGATYGGNPAAREHSGQFALDFMNQHLRN